MAAVQQRTMGVRTYYLQRWDIEPWPDANEEYLSKKGDRDDRCIMQQEKWTREEHIPRQVKYKRQSYPCKFAPPRCYTGLPRMLNTDKIDGTISAVGSHKVKCNRKQRSTQRIFQSSPKTLKSGLISQMSGIEEHQIIKHHPAN